MARRMKTTGAKELANYEPAFLLGLYRDMLRTRAVDDRIEALYKQAKLVAGGGRSESPAQPFQLLDGPVLLH